MQGWRVSNSEIPHASVITSKAAIRDRVKTGHTRSDRDRII
jgi:hypothetical protein